MDTVLNAYANDIDPKQLYALFVDVAKQYTQGDAESLPQALAERLLGGIAFALSYADADAELTLHERRERGMKNIESNVRYGKLLCHQVRASLLSIENHAYASTLRSIELGFSHYNVLFFSQDFPASIDYPTALPVSDELQGIAYINTYLRYLLMENSFLQCFSGAMVLSLLKRVCHYDAELVINLATLVMDASIGAVLAGQSPTMLSRTEAERNQIISRLAELTPMERFTLLERTADEVLRGIDINDRPTKRYLGRAMLGLMPRLSAAVDNRDLSELFPSF